MELPSALIRMLTSACENDKLKNWSIYQERDGVYSFKIRFVPANVGHIDQDSNSSVQPPAKTVHCAFKQKSESQLRRDRNRFQDWNNMRVTRSMSLKQANLQVDPIKNGPTQSAECQSAPSRISPIESFDRASDTSAAPVTPHPDASKRANPVESVMLKAVVPSQSDCECDAIDDDFSGTGDCSKYCYFADDEDNGNQNVYKCLKCSMNCETQRFFVCQPCLDRGGHAPHIKYMILYKCKK